MAGRRKGAKPEHFVAPFAVKLIHDGYASYDRFWSATHQTCLGHLLRRCHGLLETATRRAVIYTPKVKASLQQALEVRDLRDRGKSAPKPLARQGLGC